ncbi:MAG: hypothetical protein QOF58_2501 [Pseudonocardiales bacterium]|nr:hypothetical protein [Pseudonocardiales bacterium]
MSNRETNGWTRRSLLRGMAVAGVAPLLPGVAAAAPSQFGLAGDGFTLVRDGVAVDLFVDQADDPAVARAAGDLATDLERVSGVRPRMRRATSGLSGTVVLVGTIGASPVIDRLIAQGRLDTAEVAGRWEASVTQVVENPLPGVSQALVVAGSDRRGAVYGIYDTSERIGVSPWYWWADVPVERRTTVRVEAGTIKRCEPSVRYRGIFINDERNLTTWSNRTQERDKNIGPETYKKIFELLLRLKANYLWPAMHPYTDHFNKYPENAGLADEYGIVVGSSHPEALLRNGVHEWQPWAETHRNPNGSLPEYDYTVNPGVIAEYWRARVRQNAAYESCWTIGMRGLHDSGFQTRYATTVPEKVAVMNRIITDQRRILAEEVGAATGPQIFIPYKEVLDLYNAGVQVPEDITLVWPDDNHGNMRQMPTSAEQRRPGGNGLYYHISYWGTPKSYLWLDTTQISKLWQELRRAYEHRVDRLWVINVGDIKSQEAGLSFCMDLAWNIHRWGPDNIEDFLVEWTGQQFGRQHGSEIAAIRTEFYRLAAERRPEFVDRGSISLVHHGDEAGGRIAAYRDLLERTRALGRKLPTVYQNAFYELVEYPVHGAYLMNLKYYWADCNALASRQGRGAGVNRYADLCEAAHAEEEALTRRYNTEIAGGKWNGVVNPYPSDIPQAPGRPTVVRVTPQNTSGLGVAAEGNETGAAGPLSFSSYPRDRRFVDVYNTGFRSFTWRASTSHPWVQVSSTSGTVTDQVRVWVSIDWARAPRGRREATVTFTGAGKSLSVPVRVHNDGEQARRNATGFVEAHGYVSIDAAHFHRRVPRSGADWRVVRGLGRRQAAVEAVPSTAAPITDNVTTRSPELSYRIQFTGTGTFPVTVFRLPSLDARGNRRLAIALDNGPAVMLTGQAIATGRWDDLWARNVTEGVEKLTGSLTVTTPGEHVLRLLMVDPAMVVDQIVVNTGGLPATYLAPPESYHPGAADREVR